MLMNDNVKIILDSMDRMITDIDTCTKKIDSIKIVPISPTISPKQSNIGLQQSNSPSTTVQEHEWERLGIPKSTFYYRKKKGLF